VDPNMGILGTTISGLTTINVEYADPTSSANLSPLTTSYFVTGSTSPVEYRYKTDIEYFQVITGMTFSDFSGKTNPSAFDDFYHRYLVYEMEIRRTKMMSLLLTGTPNIDTLNYSGICDPSMLNYPFVRVCRND